MAKKEKKLLTTEENFNAQSLANNIQFYLGLSKDMEDCANNTDDCLSKCIMLESAVESNKEAKDCYEKLHSLCDYDMELVNEYISDDLKAFGGDNISFQFNMRSLNLINQHYSAACQLVGSLKNA